MRNNSFMLLRMKALVEEAAKALGIKNFAGLWNAYLETQKGEGGRPLLVNVTAFDGQPMELACGEYVCTDQGITKTDAKGYLVRVCPHPIVPVRRLVNIDTGEVRTEIAFRRSGAWRRAIYDKGTLASAQKIVALASNGISVNSESAKELVKYLAFLEDENYAELPEARSVGRLGWAGEYGFSPYVDGLVFDGDEQYRHAFKCVRTAGSADRWIALAREVRGGKSIVARCALAASFASALVGPLDALPFMVHMWGGAGAGKTVGLMLAASVWAAPSVGDYVKTFNGTAVANELNAAFCGSLPLCLDELQCIKDRKSFDDIVYMLCEGAGRARGAKSGGLQRVTTWRNCTISTGEMPLVNAQSGAGAMNRVIELDCKDEKLFEDPRMAVAVMTRNYGHAGKAFIAALTGENTQIDPDMMELMQGTQRAFYEQLTGKATDKQALAASVLLTADAMAEMYLFEDGRALTVEELLPYLTTSEAADANLRAHEWLLSTIACNAVHFDTEEGKTTLECWGVINGERIWLAKSVFERLMNEQGYSPASYLAWAKRAGMIECSRTEKRNFVRKRIRGIPSWCVCMAVPAEEGLRDVDGNTVLDAQNEVQQRFPGF